MPHFPPVVFGVAFAALVVALTALARRLPRAMYSSAKHPFPKRSTPIIQPIKDGLPAFSAPR